MKIIALAAACTIIALWSALSKSQAADGEPVFPAETWQTRQPGDVGLNAEKLDQFAKAVGGDGVVMRNGYLVKTWGQPDRRDDWIRGCESRGKRTLMVNFDEGRPEEHRAAWWAAYMAGGVWEAHVLPPYDRPMSAWEKTWTELGGAKAFMESLPFWEMQPHNELVKSGQASCLAKPGTTYALYLPVGNKVVIELAADKAFSVEWWNPANAHSGSFQDRQILDGGLQELRPPGHGDWAARIMEQKK